MEQLNAVERLKQIEWHSVGEKALFELLDADGEGLRQGEAEERRTQWGSNELPRAPSTPAWRILVSQFTQVLVVILLAAALVSFAVKEWKDGVAILVIVLLNGILGFIQEWKAEKAMESLLLMARTMARVRRDDHQTELDAVQLVPGDVVYLEAGDTVPADCYVLQGTELQVEESALTGESVPVLKGNSKLPEKTPLAERSNMIFAGTQVINGSARAMVVATGGFTQLGHVAQLTSEVESGPSPLQRRLATLARQLGLISVGVSLLVIVVGLLQDREPMDVFMSGVSLAVAVIPEGLAAVVTITLALGLRRMLSRQCLVRKLVANETLGSTSVICTDKTGTLTKNEMTVTRFKLADGREIRVTGAGYEPTGEFLFQGQPISPLDDENLRLMLEASVRCNHSTLEQIEGDWKVLGDTTEGALLVAGRKAGLSFPEEEEPVFEMSFSSDRKRMSVLFEENNGYRLHVKGAPEVLLDFCAERYGGEWNEDVKREILRAAMDMAESGLRVLCLASRHFERQAKTGEEMEKNLCYLGLVAMMDPARPEVREAVASCRKAGIGIVILTGDHPATALAVAKDCGMDLDACFVGSDIDEMGPEALADVLRGPFALFARVSPKHKLTVMERLRSMEKVAAMTGDGVNDAPALKGADVGIAMGVKGTDVAKQAADVVLMDDNFASIVAGVGEGRRQYDNIQKFARYLLSSNFGEVVAIAGSVVLGMPLVMLPIQILWMNVVTDGLSALALGLEPEEPDVMSVPPRPYRAKILDSSVFAALLGIGFYEGVATLLIFKMALGTMGQDAARTLAFTGLIFMEKANVFNFRSLRHPMWKIGFLSNPGLLLAVAGSLLLQMAAVYSPFLQSYLRTTPIDWRGMLILVAFSVPLLGAGELLKFWLSKRVPMEGRSDHA